MDATWGASTEVKMGMVLNCVSLQEVLAAFPRQRILVVGDIMLDEYVWGEANRISPEAPALVVEVKRRTYTPGGAGNVATNVAGLGGNALLLGVLGQDDSARSVRTALEERGVDTRGIIVDESRPTTTKTRIIAQNHQVARLDLESRVPLQRSIEDMLLQRIKTHIDGTTACIISDYGKGVISPRIAQHLIKLMHTLGKPVVVDPKGKDYRKYLGATVVTPNVSEARLALYQDDDNRDIMEVGKRLSRALEGSAVLITRGAQGMSLFMNGDYELHIPTVARRVFDVTGAGDTVVSVLAIALAAGLRLQEAAYLANRGAGIAVSKVGTSIICADELLIEAS